MASDPVAFVRGLFERHGNSDYIGENVSQQAHAVQAAMHAEAAYPRDKEMIIALLLHDLGHLMGIENKDLVDLAVEKNNGALENENGQDAAMMGDCGVRQHERIGREWALQNGLGNKVGAIIEGHVRAKRYLVTKHESYYNKLSDASRTTLVYQGGKLSQKEVEAFEADPWFELHLKARDFDDKAKIPDYKMKPLDYYLDMMTEVIQMNKNGAGHQVLLK